MILGSQSEACSQRARAEPRCSKLCSDRVGKPQIGTRQDRVVIGRFSAGNRKIRRDSREADRALVGLANRRLQPLGHLTADCKYTARKHLPDRGFSRAPYNGFSNRRHRQIRSEYRYISRCQIHELWAHSRKGTENRARADGALCVAFLAVGASALRRIGPTGS
jgi:hypothetical protein